MLDFISRIILYSLIIFIISTMCIVWLAVVAEAIFAE